jgi:hypothetical protein
MYVLARWVSLFWRFVSAYEQRHPSQKCAPALFGDWPLLPCVLCSGNRTVLLQVGYHGCVACTVPTTIGAVGAGGGSKQVLVVRTNSNVTRLSTFLSFIHSRTHARTHACLRRKAVLRPIVRDAIAVASSLGLPLLDHSFGQSIPMQLRTPTFEPTALLECMCTCAKVY